jgi:3-keto-5-aminohexanoate cleavage enzyme
MEEKVINYTPTGTQTTKENSFAPLLPNEIIEDVHSAYEIGITSVHIHARNVNDLSNTYDKNVYKEIIDGIRKHCPDLSICVSLSGRLFPEFEKRSEVLELYPDMASLTMSSLNFPKTESINSPEMINRLIDKMNDYGVIPEIECFDSGMLNYTNYLISKDIIKSPIYINVIFGNIFNAQSDLTTIASILNNKPNNSIMCFGGIGKDQLRCNTIGLLYADGVRIGLEDNLYYKEKEKTTNEMLLKRLHRIIDELGFNFMRPKTFKELGYQNGKIDDIRV